VHILRLSIHVLHYVVATACQCRCDCLSILFRHHASHVCDAGWPFKLDQRMLCMIKVSPISPVLFLARSSYPERARSAMHLGLYDVWIDTKALPDFILERSLQTAQDIDFSNRKYELAALLLEARPPEVMGDPSIKWALAVSRVMRERNALGLFALFKQASFVQGCVLHRYLIEVSLAPSNRLVCLFKLSSSQSSNRQWIYTKAIDMLDHAHYNRGNACHVSVNRDRQYLNELCIWSCNCSASQFQRSDGDITVAIYVYSFVHAFLKPRTAGRSTLVQFIHSQVTITSAR
jgi:hypothetical protein